MNGLNAIKNANLTATYNALINLKIKAKAARAQNNPNASAIELQHEKLHKELAPQLQAAGYPITD